MEYDTALAKKAFQELVDKISLMLENHDDWKQDVFGANDWIHKNGLIIRVHGSGFFGVLAPCQVSYENFSDDQHKEIAKKVGYMATMKVHSEINKYIK